MVKSLSRQLFGDTINMASRMESTGVPGRIHVSFATAHELRKHGQGHWLTQRDSKVEVKGKGQMTTYFVNVSLTRNVGVGSKAQLASSTESDYTSEDHSSFCATRRLSGFGDAIPDRRHIPRGDSHRTLTEIEV